MSKKSESQEPVAEKSAAVETAEPVEVEFVLGTNSKGKFYDVGEKAKVHPEIAQSLIGQGRVFIASIDESEK